MNKLAIKYLMSTLDWDNVLCQNLAEICNNAKSISSKVFFDGELDFQSEKSFRNSLSHKGYSSEYIDKYILDNYILDNYQNQDCYLVMDDVMDTQYESYFDNRPYFIFKEDVYFYYNIDTYSDKSFNDKLAFSSTSWHLVSVILNKSSSESIPDIVNSVSLLETSLEEIILGAFDGEGYVHYYIHS